MTIFTSKAGDKKDESDIPSPEVVSEYKLLVEADKTNAVQPTISAAIRQPPVLVVHAMGSGAGPVQRRSPLLILSIVVLMFVLLIILVFIFTQVVQSPWMPTHEAYRGHCGVRFHDKATQVLPQYGEFDQEVAIEDINHERIEVPVIGDMRRSTILHDFNQNITAIIDREQEYCFLIPLNRTLVMPPKDFWDLLLKLKSGYYIPDVDVIRENYRALTPAVSDVSIYGYNVWNECNQFGTYRLVRDDEPVAMSKRSAPFCEFAGESRCLGDAGTDKMLCIRIKGCL